jgi:hypothetical protein
MPHRSSIEIHEAHILIWLSLVPYLADGHNLTLLLGMVKLAMRAPTIGQMPRMIRDPAAFLAVNLAQTLERLHLRIVFENLVRHWFLLLRLAS